MFNLENAIRIWRRQLAEGGITSVEILEELESHLREEVDEQIRCGKAPEEAFKSALRQMGHSRELSAEFSKLPAGREEKPKYLTTFCFVAAVFIAINVAPMFKELAANASIGSVPGVTGMLAIIAYLVALPFCYRRLPSKRRPAVAWALSFGTLLIHFWILLALLSALNLVQVKLGEITVQLFWSAVPAFFATLLAYKTFAFGKAPQYPRVKAISPDADQALKFARDEATHLGHDFIGTEHVLLGLLRSENRVTSRILKRFGLHEQRIRADIEKVVGRGHEQSEPGSRPFTPRAKSVIKFAGREAAAMGRSEIGPEHLLLGILREPEGVGGVVLRRFGIDLELARAEVLKNIGPDDTSGPAMAVAT